MGVMIASQTAAKHSEPFRVEAGTVRGFRAKGLAGAEEVTLQVPLSDGTWERAGGIDTLTATEPSLRIEASGVYRWSKPETSGAAFVDSL